MQLKKILAILIAALMLFAFGCKKEAEAPAEKPAEAPAPADGSFTVTDMAGREVKFEKPVDKAVALTASDCEIIYAIGGEAALVGRGEYCDYPPEVMAIPSLTSGAETNIEQIIALEPDTVFLSMMAQTQEQVDQLEKAGIRVVVSDAQDIEGTFTAIRLIGQVLGKTEEADQIVADMNAIFDEIKANRYDGTKTIYFEVSPLQWGLWTAGTGTFMNEVAEMDYIMTITMYFGEGPTPEEEIMARPGWENVTAVKNGDILNLQNNELSRPAPRLAAGAQMLFDFVAESEAAQQLAPAA